MFGAECFRLVGAWIDNGVICRACLEGMLKEEIPGAEVNNDTLLVYASTTEYRCPIMEANAVDWEPDGVQCEECGEIVFEHTCVECGGELTNETWAEGEENEYGQPICDECVDEETREL